MTVLERIAEFVAGVSLGALPDTVVPAVKRAFIDTLGVTIAGAAEDSGRIVTEYGRENRGRAVCTVIKGGYMTTAADAALINGTLLHALDFDDTGAFTQGHPSAPVFPAILAIAEENGNTGGEIIEAYTVGVEVFSRLARAMPMMHLKGWHPSATLGSIAAAAVSAKLLKLNPAQTAHAMSIAGSQSCGLVKNFGTMTKPFHIGKAASNGVLAAKLAQKGFGGSLGLFEGNLSYPLTFFGSQPEKLEEMVSGLGGSYAIVEPGINIKKYPACSLTHRAIDALLHLLETQRIGPDDITAVDCRVPPRATKVLFYDRPSSGLEGKFSMPFVLACAIRFRSVAPMHFTDEMASDPQTLSIIDRITFGVHHDWKDGDDARADIVTVTLRDGSVHAHGIEVPAGNVRRPLSEDELHEKFRNCVSGLLTEEGREQLLSLISELDSLSSINGLTRLII